MQLPLTFFRRGLLGFMDEQDMPRGLFSFFGKDSNDEGTASDGGPPDAGSAVPPAPTDDFREPTADYVRRQLSLFGKQILTNPLGVRPPTQNPVTGEYIYLPYVNSIGERYSESLPPPANGVTPPPPKATGPVTTLSRPGFLFGPGAGAISWPQAEEAGNPVYRRPPKDDSGDEDDDEYRKKLCDEQLAREERRCQEKFGHNFRDRLACDERAFEFYQRCLRDKDWWPDRWKDLDADGWSPPSAPRRGKR